MYIWLCMICVCVYIYMIPAIGGCGTAIPAQGLLHDFLPRLVAVPGKLDYHERTLLWWNCANVADRLTTNRLYLELCCYSLNMPCLHGKKNSKARTSTALHANANS